METNFYDDLIGTDLGENILKLESVNRSLRNHIQNLETDVSRLCEEITKMKRVQDNLAKNISELFKTAKSEIARKDRIIADLRRELDDLLFKRDRKKYSIKRERDDVDQMASDGIKNEQMDKRVQESKLIRETKTDNVDYSSKRMKPDSCSEATMYGDRLKRNLYGNNRNRNKSCDKRDQFRRRSRSGDRRSDSSRSRKSEGRSSIERYPRGSGHRYENRDRRSKSIETKHKIVHATNKSMYVDVTDSKTTPEVSTKHEELMLIKTNETAKISQTVENKTNKGKDCIMSSLQAPCLLLKKEPNKVIEQQVLMEINKLMEPNAKEPSDKSDYVVLSNNNSPMLNTTAACITSSSVSSDSGLRANLSCEIEAILSNEVSPSIEGVKKQIRRRRITNCQFYLQQRLLVRNNIPYGK